MRSDGSMLCYNTLMKLYLKSILIILILFSFNACQLFEDSPELQEKKHALALKELQVSQEKELAALEMQKSLASIEKEKALELQKMQNDIKEKELSTNSEKELELIKQKVALQESNNTLTFQMYLLIFLVLILSVVVFFVFFFLKRKREDELQAYNDNLKKYFYMKENESRMKIAEKILDTIAEGDLSKENEQKLINAFSKENSPSQTFTAAITSDQTDHENDAEIIDETSVEEESRMGVTHQKENNEV